MHIVLFEDAHWQHLAPISLSRPVFSIVSGIDPIFVARLRQLSPTRVSLWVRPAMEAFCRRHVIPSIGVSTTINTPLDGEPAFLANGRLVSDIPKNHPGLARDQQSILHGTITAAGISPADALENSDRWQSLRGLPEAPAAAAAGHLWDILARSSESIIAAATPLTSVPVPPGPYHVVRPENVFSRPTVNLSPGCVLDASTGPIILADDVMIGANAVLTGPCYIGPGSAVAPLSQIRGGVSIGPRCKVGGELSNSILIGNSNKAHDGFLGDSYLGEWVNLGAGTTTSNLKNTYGEVIMPTRDGPVKTGRQFVGSMIGDHAKTAVGTRLMTGSYVGYGSMLASTAPPRVVPSFTFLTDAGAEPYRLDKVKSVMSAVFSRRGRVWTEDDEAMNRSVLETAPRVEPDRGE